MTRFLDHYFQCLKWLLAGLLMVMIVPVSLQILSRFTGVIPKYIWTEEAARFCFVWMIMIGSIIAVREEAHFDVDVMALPDEPRGKARARILIHVAMEVFGVVFLWFGWEFVRFGRSQHSEMSGINLATIYFSFPFAGLNWCVFLLEKIAGDLRILRSTSGKEAG